MADQNQLVIQSLKGADPTMVHQADAPNPVPSIIDAFRSFAQSGDYNPVHLPGTEPKDYLRELALNPDILAKNIDQSSNFNFVNALKLKHMEKLSPTNDFYHMIDDNKKHAGEVLANWNPAEKHVNLDIWSNLGPNKYGPTKIRDLINQVKNEYPEAKTVGGLRETGAREYWNKPDRNIKLKVR